MINYQKRKNIELFRDLNDKLLLSKQQNYIPIYQRFFTLNESNYNGVNLNNQQFIAGIIKSTDDQYSYKCKIKNIDDQTTKVEDAFVKIAPLLDPFKYLIGKYDIKNQALFSLPSVSSTNEEVHEKILDVNNVAYVDGFFVYLNSMLLHKYNFIHSVDYYGSFLGIKRDFKINVADDIDFLKKSDFFKKNKGILFTIDDYETTPEINNKPPIKILDDTSPDYVLSIDTITDELFDDMFKESSKQVEISADISEDKLEDVSFDFTDMAKILTLKSDSSCSSRSSHTNENESGCDDESDDSEEKEKENDSDYESGSDDGHGSDSSSSSVCAEDCINTIIPEFPVQVIFMEKCDNTLDDLILSDSLSNDEYISALMQIIMILLTYQKVFSFTHNDLHTNNVMYNKTKQDFIFYKYANKIYKVPTYGKIYKIIDFGRSIYKVKGRVFCSDSFKQGGDAATQYNTEPYFDDKKPRLEPNYSFDLCRLACSIYDYIIDDMDDSYSFKSIILDMCKDDNGINLLYKSNGVERYPDFKLYKMIARFVHNHTPQKQLERAEFKQYEFSGKIKGSIIDIDSYEVFA